MAFQVGSRVKITNEQSQYRANPQGVVIAAADDHGLLLVRLDGYPGGKGVKIDPSDLGESTQPLPVQYA
jgi:hypothetical protein